MYNIDFNTAGDEVQSPKPTSYVIRQTPALLWLGSVLSSEEVGEGAG